MAAAWAFMGIDPGKTGASAVISSLEDASTIDGSFAFAKRTDTDIWYVIAGVAESCRQGNIHLTAILEQVSIRPQDGRASGAKFMTNYGMLHGFLIAAQIRAIRVTPAVWARKLGRIDPKGTPKTEKKRRNKALAQELFPHAHVTLQNCDAFLLAEYGRRFHGE